MSEVNKNVVFVVFKHSVIVRGMERKLADAGFEVTTVAEYYEVIGTYAKETGLFVLYLPEDINGDEEKKKTLGEITDLLTANGCRAVLIGEEDLRDRVRMSFPELRRHKWVNRPVDPEKFRKTVEELINSTGDTADVGSSDAGKKRILIVDDDPSYAGMVRAWIRDVYKVDIVTAGMKAITFLLKNPVDLILLDYDMPVVDGPQVLQMLRQEESTRHIPVIFLTGISTKDEVQRVMDLKPDGYVLKSTTRENLLSYLEKRL